MSRESFPATCFADAEIQSAPPALACYCPSEGFQRLVGAWSRRAPPRMTYGFDRRSSSRGELRPNSGATRIPEACYRAATTPARSSATQRHHRRACSVSFCGLTSSRAAAPQDAPTVFQVFLHALHGLGAARPLVAVPVDTPRVAASMTLKRERPRARLAAWAPR
jgi:hypothetical protein